MKNNRWTADCDADGNRLPFDVLYGHIDGRSTWKKKNDGGNACGVIKSKRKRVDGSGTTMDSTDDACADEKRHLFGQSRYHVDSNVCNQTSGGRPADDNKENSAVRQCEIDLFMYFVDHVNGKVEHGTVAKDTLAGGMFKAIHESDREYKCSLCDFTYVYRKCLVTHMRKRHRNHSKL